MNYFTYAKAPIGSILPVAVGSLLSVAFMNLNLSYNSVGFYQLSKLACIPCTLFIQYLAYKQTVGSSIQLSLFIISLGVGYATVYDLSLNFVGFMFAICAIVATAVAQIFTNTYQKSLDCSAMQLLYLTSPIISLGMLIMCPFFDNIGELYNYEYSSGCLFRICLSCFFALGVNISNYYVLGSTSPLTYQVLGHLKTVLILVLGFAMFNNPVDSRNIVGIVIAMAGVVLYTEIKRRQSSGPMLPISSSKV